MAEYTESERDRAHIAALSHEVYRLTRQLEASERERELANCPDPDDPFANPTEYKEYSDDYRAMIPALDSPGYKMPLEPAKEERKRLRFYYTTVGLCAFFQFIISNMLGSWLGEFLFGILKSKNSGADNYAIYDYFTASSISSGLTMIIFIIANIFSSVFGMKFMKIKVSQITKTRDFGASLAFQYCSAGVFVFMAARILGIGVEDIFNHYRLTTDTMGSSGASTGMAAAILFMYTLIIAPVTEELLYRGVMLRGLSKANQRFGVYASAFMFGIAHKNIPQFLLAFLLGLFLAHITLKHGSIIPSIIVHVFINTFSVGMNMFWNADIHSELKECITIIVTGFGFLMLVIFCTLDKMPTPTPYQVRRGFPVAAVSPALLFIVLIEVLYAASLIFGVSELNILFYLLGSR